MYITNTFITLECLLVMCFCKVGIKSVAGFFLCVSCFHICFCCVDNVDPSYYCSLDMESCQAVFLQVFADLFLSYCLPLLRSRCDVFLLCHLSLNQSFHSLFLHVLIIRHHVALTPSLLKVCGLLQRAG